MSYDTVERYWADTMDAMVAQLTEAQALDAIIVGALLEVRERLGDPRQPERLGGVSIYVAALQVPTGRPLWVQLYDATKQPPNVVYANAVRIVGWRDPAHYLTAREIAEHGIGKLVKSMAKAIP